MENASKALLIAASVLIVIILVAFGMKIFNSPQEVLKDAKKTGEAISTSTGKAVEKFKSVTNVGEKEEVETQIIQFKIDGIACYAKKGMLWEEWVKSSYNEIGVKIVSSSDFVLTIVYNNKEVFFDETNTHIVPLDGEIYENHSYIIGSGDLPM